MEPTPAKRARRRPSEQVAASVIEIDLAAELRKLRASETYRRNDHASETLVNVPGLGAVLIALPKGGHLKEHRAPGPITIQVLEGSIRLALSARTIEMSAGEVTHLAQKLAHRVEALDDAGVLLTIGGTGD